MACSRSDRPIGELNEDEILNELQGRIQDLAREVKRLREPAEEMLRLRARRDKFLREHADDSEELRSLDQALIGLALKSEHEGLSVDDEVESSRLWDRVLLLMLLDVYGELENETSAANLSQADCLEQLGWVGLHVFVPPRTVGVRRVGMAHSVL